MMKWIIYSIPLAFTWVFVNGTFNTPSFMQGMAIGLLVSYVFRRFYTGEFRLAGLKSLVYVPRYIANFLKELFIANADTTYRVLHPEKPVDPAMIRYRTTLENPLAITILANSITLTPGTLVVDFFEDSFELKIHVLSGDIRGTEETIENWESKLNRIFGDRK